MQDMGSTYMPWVTILVYHVFLLADEGRLSDEESQINIIIPAVTNDRIASSHLEYLGIDRTCAWPRYRTTRNYCRRGYVCPSCSCLESHAYGSHNPFRRTTPEADSCHRSRDGARGSRNRQLFRNGERSLCAPCLEFLDFNGGILHAQHSPCDNRPASEPIDSACLIFYIR